MLLVNVFVDVVSRQSKEDVVRFLDDHPGFVDPPIYAPVAIAVHINCTPDILSFLIQRGCDIDKRIKTIGKWTPLHLVIMAERLDLLDILLSSGANHYKGGGRFLTPALVSAARLNRVDMLERLLQHDRNQVNITDYRGVTALRSAAKFGCVEAARFLLSRGADPHMADKDGMTPLRMCRSDDFFGATTVAQEVVRIVKARGQIARLLEEEERAYLVHKAFVLHSASSMISHAGTTWSTILKAPYALRDRLCRKRVMPKVMYHVSGMTSSPGGSVEMMTEGPFAQQVLHEVWGLKEDVFREFVSYLF